MKKPDPALYSRDLVMATKPDNAAMVAFFHAELLAAWLGLPEESRPLNVWLRQHAPFVLRDQIYQPDSPVEAAWIAKEGKILSKTVPEFLRFYLAQVNQVWSTGMNPPPQLPRCGPREFALASFAPILGTDDFFFEWQFAGLYGRGLRYRFEKGEFHLMENLWIS